MSRGEAQPEPGPEVSASASPSSESMAPQEGRREILAAVDFSPHSRAALEWAADACERFDLPLEVVHVVHDPGSAPGSYRVATEALKRLEDVAQEQLQEFLRQTMAAHPTSVPLAEARRTLVVGLPVQRILEVATGHGAELIVLGSQGRTGLPHLLLGSIAQRVAQLSPVPVTIVKAPGSVEAADEIDAGEQP